jgi:glycosyltransferase involved in cell wall biosynthesis
MSDLTAIILTKNEKLNIEQCILSIKSIAKRIVVVDSYSDDETIEIAKKLGADVYLNKFVNYASQFNWALDNASISTKWCLRIDADERFTPKLTEEIEKIIQSNVESIVNGIVLEAQMFFMGKKLNYGASRKRKLMVFKTNFGKIEKRRMDEHTVLSEGETIYAKNKYLHYDFKDIDIFVKKLNWYATREMQDYTEYKETKQKIDLNDKKINRTRFKKFKIYYRFPLFIRSKFLFIYFYVLKLGFLDGKEGYIYNYLYTRFYRLLVDIKIYEQQKFQNEFIETGDLK